MVLSSDIPLGGWPQLNRFFCSLDLCPPSISDVVPMPHSYCSHVPFVGLADENNGHIPPSLSVGRLVAKGSSPLSLSPCDKT